MNTDIETFADALVDMIRARYATRDFIPLHAPRFTDRDRACVPMHTCGHPVRPDALAEHHAVWFATRDRVFIREPDGARSNYWLNAFPARDLDEREALLEYTNARGVMTRPLWTPMHELAPYRDCLHADLTNTLWVASRLINIPSSVPPDF